MKGSNQLHFPEYEIRSSEIHMNLFGLNKPLGAELWCFVFKFLLSLGTKICEFPFHTCESSYQFHFDVFTLMAEHGLKRIQGFYTDSDLNDASRTGSLVGTENLLQSPSKKNI